jgi:ribosomal protein S18 acetylase RimI-like enzyme
VAYVDAHDQVSAFILFRDLGEALEIEMLATHPDFLRQGIMTRLLAEVFRRAQNDETRLKAVWLEVHEHNALARQLYEKSGFNIVGKRPRYYSDGGAAILYNYG